MKKKNYAVRHGDVVVVAAKKIPKEAEAQKEAILAYGEVSFHAHRITEGTAKVFKYNEKTYLKVISEYALLTHEEHKEIKLPCGDYEFWIQQEWKEDGWAKVLD